MVIVGSMWSLSSSPKWPKGKENMRWFSLVLAFVFPLLSVAIVAAQGETVTIALPAVNGSGESGTVALTPSGSNLTEVVITLNNQPLLQTKYNTINGQQVIDPSTYGGAVPQLAGIYSGTCSNLQVTNPPNLGATTPNGPNVTGNGWFVVSKPVADILAGHYVLAVHKDATDKSPLVACTELIATREIPATTLPKTGTPRAALVVLAGTGLLLIGCGGWLRRRTSSARRPLIPGVFREGTSNEELK